MEKVPMSTMNGNNIDATTDGTSSCLSISIDSLPDFILRHRHWRGVILIPGLCRRAANTSRATTKFIRHEPQTQPGR